MIEFDLVVIGGGPAGMAAALEAKNNGIDKVLIIERDRELGGILQQCIHNGFGLHYFGEELTGPEYAWRFIQQVDKQGIEYKLNTMVLNISPDKVVTAINSIDGLIMIKCKAIVLAMGCRERTRGALNIPGSRPAGIYTAGAAQRFVNMEGYLPGKKIVILGSGDIGLIMARRLTLEDAEVKMVCELLPYSGGLMRNIVQCLEDYDIPLKLSHTIVNIHGKDRLQGVTIAAVDQNGKPIEETKEYIECDTLLLSVGLIPENELTKEAGIPIDVLTSGPKVSDAMETCIEGIYACGNVVHVHDLVDYVTQESMIAGKNAALFILRETEDQHSKEVIKTIPGEGVRYVVPQYINRSTQNSGIKLFFRVTATYQDLNIVLRSENQIIHSTKKAKVSPGEMQNITLTSKMLKEMEHSNSITVNIDCKQH